jgi:esterase/lipase superfamily enzyme
MARGSELSEAVAVLWDELPELVGPEWEEFSAALLIHLRALESGDEQSRNRIVALFDGFPAARERLVDVMSQLVSAVLKGAIPKDEAPPLVGRRQRHVRVPVFYATDREDTGAERPGERFGGGRGELGLGVATVSIPDDHRMGEVEKPRWWKLEFSANPDKHVVLLSLEPLDRGAFVARAREAAGRARKRSGLVFVHGYNVGFEAAAQRAAQIAYDLGYEGLPMLFSWPSTGRSMDYTVDEANVRWAERHYREFIHLCAMELTLDSLHVVAHSMGNRVVAETLGQLRIPDAGAAHLEQIVFAAPDIDADTFRDLAREFRERASGLTLYASTEDYALKASKLAHGYPRAGDSGEGLVIVDGVHTIDATAVDTSLLGHSYYGENRSILADVFNLLRGRREPADRFGLTEMRKDGRLYWLFKP